MACFGELRAAFLKIWGQFALASLTPNSGKLFPLFAVIYSRVYSLWTFLMRQLIVRVYPLAYFFERFVELYSNTFGSVRRGRSRSLEHGVCGGSVRSADMRSSSSNAACSTTIVCVDSDDGFTQRRCRQLHTAAAAAVLDNTRTSEVQLAVVGDRVVNK